MTKEGSVRSGGVDHALIGLAVVHGLVEVMPFTNKGGQLVRWRAGVLKQIQKSMAAAALHKGNTNV